ncbi:MAG: hypothetical protein PWP24_469 [Clostridiales bacterium]|nr:hypothetical protein [Clostridiales bacterium]
MGIGKMGMLRFKRMCALMMALFVMVSSVEMNVLQVSAATKSEELTINKTSWELKIGDTVKLKAKNKTKNKGKIVWSSKNKKIATVTSKGVVKGSKNGTTTITARIKRTKIKATCKIKVITPATAVVLDKTSATLKVGETVTINGTISPKTASNKTLVFRSSDESVATVSSQGVIEGVKAGTATITVKVKNTKLSESCEVTVVKPKTNETVFYAPSVEENGLSYNGYKLKWSDDFEGTALNKQDWNVETHQAGWVNNELQEYVDSEQNIVVKDGKLTIKPVKMVDDKGNVSYTSGRVNTQNKHDYKYGLFEVRAKVPAGKGYLPAFWMMPTNENIYGQWPRCGEIDIMEVMGQQNDKLYGTIHYGNPHSESQGTYLLANDNFTDNFHTFSCEWEPGKIRWYIDGLLYHEESDWYSTTVGQGTITYPAPFDQPFYMILNLAVGGNWVGYPDATTDFEKEAFVIDYVKAYQKDSYDENVTRPIKQVVLRDPDANGNYVNNGDFATAEDLTDTLNWETKTALGGEAVTTISDNAIKIATTNAGTVDYSVQLVQAGIPFEKGATYVVSFDAVASEARTMKTAVKAPDRGYAEYMTSKTVDLTTDKKTYTYEFKMTSDSDSNGRLEFNMGYAGSTADIYISKVSITKTKSADPNEKEVKTILADGNYVYNGSFQEGIARLGYWEITNAANASVLVTNENMDRRLKVVVSGEEAKAEDVLIAQSDLALTANKVYSLSFDAQADAARDMRIMIAGQEVIAKLSTDKKSYNYTITLPETVANKNIAFYLGQKGTTYLDNVRLVEDAMIKNGSFNAGFAGYEWFVDSSAQASSVVDSLTETNAADITVNNTGDADWKIQLKQNNVELQNGQWYKLTFKAKSSFPRKIRVIMQGLEAKGWAVYSGENIVSLTNEYQIFEKDFMMTADTDPQAFLCVALGAVDGEVITTQHRVCVDDISLVKIEAPAKPGTEAGVNMLKNAAFNDPIDSMKDWKETIADWEPIKAAAVRTLSDGAITYQITNPGTDDWNVQLKQSDLSLEAGQKYKVTFDVISSESREIKSGVMSTAYVWYGGGDIALEANVSKNVMFEFTMGVQDPAADFYISMGKIAGLVTPGSTITISNLSLVKVAN